MTQIDFADETHNYFAYDADSNRVDKRDVWDDVCERDALHTHEGATRCRESSSSTERDMVADPSVAVLDYAVNCIRIAFGNERSDIRPDATLGDLAGRHRHWLYRVVSSRPLSHTLVRRIRTELNERGGRRDWTSLTVADLGDLLADRSDAARNGESAAILATAFPSHPPQWPRWLHTLACREELSFAELMARYWRDLADHAEVIHRHLELTADHFEIPYGFWRPQDVLDADDEDIEDWCSSCVTHDLQRDLGWPIPRPPNMGIIPLSIVEADPLLRDAQDECRHTVHYYVHYAAYLYQPDKWPPGR